MWTEFLAEGSSCIYLLLIHLYYLCKIYTSHIVARGNHLHLIHILHPLWTKMACSDNIQTTADLWLSLTFQRYMTWHHSNLRRPCSPSLGTLDEPGFWNSGTCFLLSLEERLILVSVCRIVPFLKFQPWEDECMHTIAYHPICKFCVHNCAVRYLPLVSSNFSTSPWCSP